MAPARRGPISERSRAPVSPSSYLHYWQHGIARNRVASRRILAYSATLSARLLIPGSLKRPAPRSRSHTHTHTHTHTHRTKRIGPPLSVVSHTEPHGRFTSLFLRLEPRLAPFRGSRPNHGRDRDQLHRSYCARRVAHRATC